jgi:hypothetical protein
MTKRDSKTPCYINKLGTDGDHRPRPGPRPMVTAPGPRVGNNHYAPALAARSARPQPSVVTVSMPVARPGSPAGPARTRAGN